MLRKLRKRRVQQRLSRAPRKLKHEHIARKVQFRSCGQHRLLMKQPWPLLLQRQAM
jgi:hypothetical protein